MTEIDRLVVDMSEEKIVLQDRSVSHGMDSYEFPFYQVFVQCECGETKMLRELIAENWIENYIQEHESALMEARWEKGINNTLREDNPKIAVDRSGKTDVLIWNPTKNPWYCSEKCETVGGLID